MKLSSKVQALTDLIAPAVAACNVMLWGIEFRPQGKRSLLRIYIDLPNEQKNPEATEKENSVSVEDCKRVSHQVSGLLDVHDPIAGEYVLEVSSPGWDRQFFNIGQLEAYINESIAVRLIHAIENRRKFIGKLQGVKTKESHQVIKLDISNTTESEIIELPVSNIDKANLIYDE